eukprot:gb/GEZN01001625.1/.p1 GENE.gb/GEZN01001625.1/~~gb/GEZN01001625.1/.p1  ORF type:complete len:810 (-),score=79.07 gb/GEZN01001625.1/:404-2833(-)
MSTTMEYSGWVEPGVSSDVSMGLVGAGTAALFAIIFYIQISIQPLDYSKPKTVEISKTIARCAAEFLIDEYKALLIFVLLVAIFLAALALVKTMLCFLLGAFLSASTGWIGMKIATKANVRTTFACQGPNGLNQGLQIAFKSGAVMGLSVVAAGLSGVTLLYLIFDWIGEEPTQIWNHLAGFAFGASSIALFARVGGGIYTKAADVGADLVGKVEEELAEDSADNPATIADNVGDNVGDVAGMGADLFESYVGSLIAACTLGWPRYGHAGVLLPIWTSGLGSLCAIAGILMLRTHDKATHNNTIKTLESLLGSIRFSIYGASLLAVGTSIISLGASFGLDSPEAWKLGFCVLIGLVTGNLIGFFTEYATSYTYEPTKSIARMANIGAAPVIIQGLGVGMLSTIPPVVFIVTASLACNALEGIYGISIAAVGMLSTLGVTLATDAFGPVADNAGGIAEMAPGDEIDDEVRDATDALDALGNTTAATGKGFAIGSAVLTALALLNAFAEATGLEHVPVDILDQVVLPSVLFGAMLPFVFAALTMLSVGAAAEAVMWECRDQLNRKAFDGLALSPDRCVHICAQQSLREMVPPGALAVLSPLFIGFMLGPKGLLGMLLGSIASGFLLALMMSNAGGAWDNAKKWVEKLGLGEGKGKNTKYHKAVVVGDTVGDPFKDTSGPALNILVKLMSIVSLVIAPLLSTKGPNGILIPNKDYARWREATGLIGGVIALAFVYRWLMNRYAFVHDKNSIIQQSEERSRLKPSEMARPEGPVRVHKTDAPRGGSTKTPLLNSDSYGAAGVYGGMSITDNDD